MTFPNLPILLPRRSAWNKGRIVGQKRPLLPKHVWAIRVRLELAGNLRDLALFNMAVDSKLRGCDLVRLNVRDVFVGGRVKERASIIQNKTQRPVQFEVTEGTRNSVLRWVQSPAMIGSEHLWPGRFLSVAAGAAARRGKRPLGTGVAADVRTSQKHGSVRRRG